MRMFFANRWPTKGGDEVIYLAGVDVVDGDRYGKL